jgi:hypothetical protein
MLKRFHGNGKRNSCAILVIMSWLVDNTDIIHDLMPASNQRDGPLGSFQWLHSPLALGSTHEKIFISYLYFMYSALL